MYTCLVGALGPFALVRRARAEYWELLVLDWLVWFVFADNSKGSWYGMGWWNCEIEIER